MNILVLGGSRFVGRAIVDALVDRHDVTVLNRGTRSFSDERVRQLVADRTDPAQLGAVLGGQVYDAVVDVSGTEPLHVKNVLPALAWQGGSPYVYVSSAAVYDRTRATTPFRESDPDGGDGIWGDYGYNKASCERLLRTALGNRLIVLRPPA